MRRIALIVIGTLLFVQGYAQRTTTFIFKEAAPDRVLRVMEKNANALFAEINRKYDQYESQLDLPSSGIGKDARDRITTMWALSHFYCTRTSMNAHVFRMISSDAYQVRNIPIYYKNGESDEYSYQSVVLEFDLTGKIIDLYCSIPEHDIKRADGSVVTDFRHKEQINRLINRYYTAYYNKDVNVIEKLFSEDAMIVMGKTLKYYKAEGKTYANHSIEYSVQNKNQYLAKLRKIFQKNSFINIKFDNVSIVQSKANPKFFGVRLNQYWKVSNNFNAGYYDEGCLFFIIDFTNEEQPEVWVRTWQPFQDANGNPIYYSEEDYFSIADFQIE